MNQPNTATVEIGQFIPGWQVQATSGKIISSDSLKGKQFVLYFYPKDNTPGCTIEGHGFRDAYSEFTQLNTEIFGVSRDTLASHEKFKTGCQFPFELISDTDEILCQLFDVIKDKSMFGKKYKGIERSTFLIDKQGILRHIWRKVSVKNHVKEVLATARSLAQQSKN